VLLVVTYCSTINQLSYPRSLLYSCSGNFIETFFMLNQCVDRLHWKTNKIKRPHLLKTTNNSLNGILQEGKWNLMILFISAFVNQSCAAMLRLQHPSAPACGSIVLRLHLPHNLLNNTWKWGFPLCRWLATMLGLLISWPRLRTLRGPFTWQKSNKSKLRWKLAARTFSWWLSNSRRMTGSRVTSDHFF